MAVRDKVREPESDNLILTEPTGPDHRTAAKREGGRLTAADGPARRRVKA